MRLAKLALNNGIAGALEGPSAYLMKSPPKQIVDDEAYELVRGVHQAERAQEGQGEGQGRERVPLRRIFLLGAAALVSVAALVAIGTVLSGDFGETEGKIFATLATTFVAGSTVDRGPRLPRRATVARPRHRRHRARLRRVRALVGADLGRVRRATATGSWSAFVTAWALAVLVVDDDAADDELAVARCGRSIPATAAARSAPRCVATVMILREQGDGWQLFAVLLILALLGEALAPILERYAAAEERPAERLLGVVGGRRGRRGARQPLRRCAIGERTEPLRHGESESCACVGAGAAVALLHEAVSAHAGESQLRLEAERSAHLPRHAVRLVAAARRERARRRRRAGRCATAATT